MTQKKFNLLLWLNDKREKDEVNSQSTINETGINVALTISFGKTIRITNPQTFLIYEHLEKKKSECMFLLERRESISQHKFLVVLMYL